MVRIVTGCQLVDRVRIGRISPDGQPFLQGDVNKGGKRITVTSGIIRMGGDTR
jgi:hypothetical protein